MADSTYNFTEPQIATLFGYINNGDYAGFYNEVYAITANPDAVDGTVADADVREWFRVAADANAGVDPASALIRSYTTAQISIRLSSSVSPEVIQEASDRIAQAVWANHILIDRALPTLEEIKDQDAPAVVDVLRSHGYDVGFEVWSGNLLFVGLGEVSPLTDNLIPPSSTSPYDLVVAAQSLREAGLGTIAAAFWDSLVNGVTNASAVGQALAEVHDFLVRLYGDAAYIVADELALNPMAGRQGDYSDNMTGTTGDDLIVTSGGDDTVIGTSGDDFIDGGDGFDTVDFSAHTYSIYFDWALRRTGEVPYSGRVITADFDLNLMGPIPVPDLAAVTELFNIEAIILGSGGDVIWVEQPTENLKSIDGGGNGSTAVDILHYVNNDTVKSISVDGDVLSLEALVPAPVVVASAEGIGEGEPGAIVDLDNPQTQAVQDGTLTFNGITVTLLNFEHVLGTDGDDAFYGTGVEFGSGVIDRNVLFGFGGNDTLVGRGGEDALIGDAGDDVLYGGFWTDPGNEFAYQDDGETDLLLGGGDNDRYYVSNNDHVVDMTLEEYNSPSFVSTGDGTVYFNGKQLTEGERIAEEDWDQHPFQSWVTYDAPEAQVAIFRDHDSGFLYRVFSAVTYFDVNQQQIPVYYYVLGVEDWNTKTVFQVSNVEYDPETGVLGFPTEGGGVVAAAMTASTASFGTSGSGIPAAVVDLGDDDGTVVRSSGTGEGEAHILDGGSGIEAALAAAPAGDGTLAAPSQSVANSATGEAGRTGGGTLASTTLAAASLEAAAATVVTGTFLGIDFAEAPTIDGTSGDDVLSGSTGSDVLYAGAGNDTIRLKGGDDYANGGTGNDLLDGGGGNDTLEGGAGADTIKGGTGTDTADYRTSNAGVYVDLSTGIALYGHAAGDSLNSIENLAGSGLGDQLYGDAGNNVLSGRGGSDSFRGNGGSDVFDGGEDNDGVLFDWVTSGGVTIDLAAGLFAGAAAGSTYISIESFLGTSFGDSIAGDENRNDFYGASGNDTLDGRGGDDFLVGGAGADSLTGGSGADLFVYRYVSESGPGVATRDVIADFVAGEDRLDFASVDADTSTFSVNDAFAFIGSFAFSGIAGELRYEQIGGNTWLQGDNNGDGIADIEIELLGLHDLGLADFRAGSVLPYLFGTANADTIVTGDGADTIFARGGDDTVDAGAGDDQLIGGAGADTLAGGAGADLFILQQAADSGPGAGSRDVITDFTPGEDRLDLSGIDAQPGVADNQPFILIGTDPHPGAEGSLRYEEIGTGIVLSGDIDGDGLADFEIELMGLSSITADDIIGAEGPVTLVGTAGNDTLTGGIGDDMLSGLGGHDRLIGREGADQLFGGDGSDVLDGGPGADVLDGGADRDIITYESSSSGVVIDFGLGIGAGGEAEGDIFVDIETAVGSAFDDTFHGSTGYDEMFGDDGADYFTPNGGDDVVVGNGGIDTIDFSWSSIGVAVNLFEFVWLDWYGTQVTASFAEVGFAGVPRQDYLYITFTENVLGTDQYDWMRGDAANNTFIGGGGDDRLHGEGGNDWLNGGSGNDLMTGGTGTDGVDYRTATSGVYLDLANTISWVFVDGNTYTSNYAYLAGGEEDHILDVENAIGSEFADTIIGSGGANWFDGLGGDDAISGGNGNDQLLGGDGDDVLEGGSGADTLDGGAGLDTFVFGLGGGADRVEDFEDGIDRLSFVDGLTFADLTITDSASGALISYGGTDSVLVRNMLAADLTEADMVFGGVAMAITGPSATEAHAAGNEIIMLDTAGLLASGDPIIASADTSAPLSSEAGDLPPLLSAAVLFEESDLVFA